MGYVIAFILGACTGVFLLSLCVAATDRDKNMKGSDTHADAGKNQITD